MKETICIPPRSEMVCQGHLLLPSDTEYRGPLVIEASEKFQKLGKALVARSLTNAGKEVLLRLMNVSCNPQTVYKNTVVGSTSPVVNIIENKEQIGSGLSLSFILKTKRLPVMGGRFLLL